MRICFLLCFLVNESKNYKFLATCFYENTNVQKHNFCTDFSLCYLVDFFQCPPRPRCRWVSVRVFCGQNHRFRASEEGPWKDFLGLVSNYTVACKKFKRKYHNRNFENYHRIFKKYSFNFSLYPKRKFHHRYL